MKLRFVKETRHNKDCRSNSSYKWADGCWEIVDGTLILPCNDPTCNAQIQVDLYSLFDFIQNNKETY